MENREFWTFSILSWVFIAFKKALLKRFESELATSKFQGSFNRTHRKYHWATVLNFAIIDCELGRKPVFVSYVFQE